MPLLTAHRITELDSIVHSMYAFVAFSLSASAIYIVNDLLDLESDRQHPRKKYRPFAAGLAPISYGVVAVPTLVAISLGIATSVLPAQFAVALLSYCLVAVCYSVALKKTPLVDVLILAVLYILRILGGGLALEIAISNWLLAFSAFCFLSIALLKRYCELLLLEKARRMNAAGRGYLTVDKEFLKTLGITTGSLAVLVFALYIDSPQVRALYHEPTVLWLICPLLMYWLGRMWFLANRGELEDDPIEFMVRDGTTYITWGAITMVMLAAS